MKNGAANREVWLQWRWRGLFPGARVVHWKGYALQFSSVAVVLGAAYATEKQLPYLALYWIAVLAWVAVFWMLVLDHSEWKDRS